MKLIDLLNELVMPPALKAKQYELEKDGYTKVGGGDNGIVMEKGSDVKKLTTDVDELEHAEKLLNHSFSCIIPIYKVERLAGGKTGVIDMTNAEQLAQQEAQDLSNVLKYGALPLAFDRGEVQQVSPSLGADQLRGGLIAGILGLALVIIYSLLYYRGLGIVSVGSLLVAASLALLAFLLLGETISFTLTLAGIAGAIVAIGITADSFIVYFERIRDEVREGKSLKSAVETGWLRARRTVVVADAVSMIAAIMLYFFAVGGVRGFAFTLGLTTIIDLIVVFFFTKPLVTVLARYSFFSNGHPLSGFSAKSLGIVEKQIPQAGEVK